VEYRPNTKTAILIKQATLRAGHIREVESKRRKLNRSVWFLYTRKNVEFLNWLKLP
jgi:hypothetical protein